MRKSRLAALTLGAAAIMQLTLGAIALQVGQGSAIAGEIKPLPSRGGVKIGNIQYRNSETSPNPKLEQAIRRELQDYTPSSPDQYVRYYYNRVDLNDDGKPEVVVYLLGSYTCGSGGCTTLIFTPKGQDYRLVSELTLVNDPILVTPQKTSGWKDLVLLVSGGGARSQYSRLRFNGRTYPGNPSVQPALKPNSTLTGIALVADASSSPGNVLRPR
jgi:hypothetical protein